jgi:hypothetical protein
MREIAPDGTPFWKEGMANGDTFKIDISEHAVGDKECSGCWGEYPKPCSCGGLIHAEFGDENADGDYWLMYTCDKCGDTSQPEDA